jgi:photosystem II stability/assembly factor-like uncharacterized protein
MRNAALLGGLAVIALVLAGCGSRARPPQTTPLPAGFVPQALAVTGAQDLWLLGRVPCRQGRCYAVARTTDGGRSFTTTAAPPLPTQGSRPELWRSGSDDGFVFVPGARPVLYATHDGGATWHRSRQRGIIAFATAGGNAYAVAAHCSQKGCTGYGFARSEESNDSWTESALPFVPDGSVLDLSARDDDVWLLGTRAGGQTAEHDVLAHSTDAGRSFATGPGPCYPGLGGSLEPAGDHAVWAVCPTGMQAGAWRSTDDGATFRHLRTPSLVNSSQLAPASARAAALIGTGTASRILHTTDGGATWTRAATPRGATSVAWLGFGGDRVGYALAQTGWNAKTKVENVALWRTTDGGASWSRVALH